MNQSRIFFLDNLRAFVVFLVVVLHGSLTYMAFAPEWWYVLDPENSFFFTAVVLLVDVPIMQALFFIAGYFAYPSLAKRGSGAFIREKSIRIGLPWLVGVLLLAPPTAYMIYVSRGVPVSLGEFWTNEFWGPLYQQSVYWFLGILFLLFVLLGLAYAGSKQVQNLAQRDARPTWRLFAAFVILMTAGFLLMNLFFPLDTWSHIYIFMFQPLRLALYAGYFLLGLYGYLRGWFTAGGYRPGWTWLLWFVVSGLLYLAYRVIIPGPEQTTVLLKLGNAILFNVFCLSALLAAVRIFERRVNGSDRFWRSQSRNSYGIYYVHPLFLYPLAYFFVPVTMSVFLKAPLVIAIAWLLSWGFSALVLTRLPGLRRIF